MAVMLAEAGPRTEAVPSVSDADRAAEAFVAAGVCEVWLFGSVALGEPTEASDIDLVAVYADLDYAQRWDRRRDLAESGEQVCGWPVDVLVTDLPRWWTRSGLLTTFERRVRDQARLLRTRPVSPPEVNWDKEIQLPTSDDQEALYVIRNAAWALGGIERDLTPGEGEPAAAMDREGRMGRLCLNAQMAAECALKAMVHLYGHRPPENTHDLEALIRALPRDIADSAGRLLDGIDKHAMSNWRLVGTYPADYPEAAAQAPALAEPYVCAAVALNRYAADHTQARVGPAPELANHRAILNRIHTRLDDRQIPTSRPRTGPPPLTTPSNLTPPRPRP